ncbi:MAG: TetR/AcrR family transcriptional regulator [Acidimicrobiia bacterium]|nr:TetR/AcrR family transcriptional regulator [Acidimicrobiia bacterium]
MTAQPTKTDTEISGDPRIVATRRRVLEATAELLVQRGFANTSIEGVAAASGVAKSTIYRHWPSREQLCIDAYRSVVQPQETPNTGVTRDDLVTLLTRLTAGLGNSPWARILPSLIDAAERDGEVAAFHRELTRHRRVPMRTVLELGQQRGDIPVDVDLDYVIDLLSAPLFYRRFIYHADNDRKLVEQIVDDVLAGLSRH